jgi:hypothetical protein
MNRVYKSSYISGSIIFINKIQKIRIIVLMVLMVSFKLYYIEFIQYYIRDHFTIVINK